MYHNIFSIMVSCLLFSAMMQGAGAAVIGSDSVTISGYILPHQTLNANFTAFPRSGSVPLLVHFTDLSTGNPTAWRWDFTNDGTVDSTYRNPSYLYTHTGTYSVRLRVTNRDGSDTEIKTTYITVNTPDSFVRIAALEQYVNGLPSSEWSKWLLTQQLRNAEQSLENGNDRRAVLHMRSFIQSVRMVRWFRNISQSQANYLISEAEAIISLIQV